MQTVNNYEVEWEKGNTVGSGLFNGEVGVIESINHTKEFMKIRFDDKTIEYDFDNLDDLDLSYAITVHKSQGSEYPVVIIPMYSCSPMLMTRNLFYTAVTRARKMVILVGRPDIPMRMVENDFKIHRYTTLKNKISEYK
jgi:exodeoxyribonuclease V alpha subunit